MDRIDHQSRKPLYVQLRELLERQILQGQLKEGELIPSERELAEQYGLSSTTVRRALQELVHKRLIRRHPGIGSFVSSDSKDLQLLLLILGFGEADFRKYSHPFGDLIAGVAKVTWERQATFSIMHVPSGTADAESLMRSILSEERFDGIILRIAGDLQELSLVPFTEIDFPYVVVKRYLPDRMHNCVVEDDHAARLKRRSIYSS